MPDRGEHGVTPPGSETGACVHGGGPGTWESRLSPCGERKGVRRRSGRKAKSRRHGRSPAPATSLRKRRHKRQKTGKAGYRRRTEKIERLRDGLAAVLAEHSTDGRNFGRLSYRTDREGGEVTPKRPAAGKVNFGRLSYRTDREGGEVTPRRPAAGKVNFGRLSYRA
ncbi:hypothetical protein QUF72_11775 [Desulfobacterales bacterium HSG2]|nr:hypothetical protein [Desulfobacterales bacterium HSG2]